MTKALQAVLGRVNDLPAKRQDEIAEMLDRLIGSDEAHALLTASDWAEIDRRLASEPRFATDDEVEAFFRAAEA